VEATALYTSQCIYLKISKNVKALSPPAKKEKRSREFSRARTIARDKSFRSNDSFYHLLVESLTGYAIFTTNKEGNISSWNAGAFKLFGYSKKEIIGKKVSIIFRRRDVGQGQLQKELKKAAKKGKVVVERYHVRKNHSQFWASGLIFSLFDRKNVARGFTFIVRDLTEKMEFEKRKDAFISTATHELKTPITSMKLYAQVVEQEIKGSKNKKSIQSVFSLNKQLDKVMALMDYLLDVAKIQEGTLELKKTFFDMNRLIQDIIATIQIVSKEHTIIQEGKFNKKIYGDRDRIGQVLANLISNAVKYSPGTKKVIVHGTEHVRDVTTSVKDFGLGISKAEQPAIFGRFYRTNVAVERKIEGIGLGLYVAQEIVKAHKGRIWLESTEGNGSTFYFNLPRKVA